MKLMKKNKRRSDHGHRPRWVEVGFDLPLLFDDFNTRNLALPSFNATGVSTPAVNIIETNEDFRLEMVAPGMQKEDFNVSIEGNVLTVSYDHEDNREEDGKNWKYITHEYNYHSFSRSFSLPEMVVVDNIQAKYENGILILVIPKKDEAKKKPSRQIAVA